jgi:Arc/MetJ family transcription regulator
MRTNIVLDEKLIEQARRLTDLPTKKAIVDEALRTLIRVKKQERILSLKGKIRWEGDLDQSRSGRNHAGHR